MKRRIALLLVGVCAATGFAACGNRRTDEDRLLRYIATTERLAARYVYVDERFDDLLTGQKGRKLEVQGLKEDDFRFKARVLINGGDAFDEVVSDDTLAMRFLEPASLNALVNKDVLQSSETVTTTDREGINVLDAMRSRRWVLDASAAPSITVGARKVEELGVDPVLDALTALRYVESAVTEAFAVERWSDDDLDPAYVSSEDDFPKPETGSGVARYDLRRPSLPPAVNRSGRSDTAFPSTRHFRKMAIYVKDERIIQVQERVELRGKKLDDFIAYNRAVLKANDVPQELRDQFDQAVDERPDDEAGDLVFGRTILQGLNVSLAGFGIDPILVRSMDVDFRDLGADVKVDLPTEETIKASLDFLLVTDKGKAKAEAGAGSPATTPTTVATETPTSTP